jgi:hypothetical protein
MRLGSDPEILLRDKTGKHLSVIGLIGAGKWNPKQIEGMNEGFTLQEDNVALEFGVPPASNADEFVKNIRSVLKAGLSTLPGMRFSRLSCTVFPEDQMQDPMAHIFGCEPDFNAWTGEENNKPSPPHPFMRSAGGHIHVETELDKEDVIRAMDLFLGVPSVLLDNDVDRRKLYGKAGAFRPKPYGVEYRTLSNFWVFRPNLIRWVWKQTEEALAMVDDVTEWTVIQAYCADAIQDCINTGNKKEAQFLMDEFQLEMP